MVSNNQLQQNQVPRYIVNLDDKPEIRWNNIINDYKTKLLQTESILKKQIGKFIHLSSFVLNFAFNSIYYSQDILAFSKGTGISKEF